MRGDDREEGMDPGVRRGHAPKPPALVSVPDLSSEMEEVRKNRVRQERELEELHAFMRELRDQVQAGVFQQEELERALEPLRRNQEELAERTEALPNRLGALEGSTREVREQLTNEARARSELASSLQASAERLAGLGRLVEPLPGRLEALETRLAGLEERLDRADRKHAGDLEALADEVGRQEGLLGSVTENLNEHLTALWGRLRDITRQAGGAKGGE